MTLPVVLVAAVGRNGAIGLRDGLPWRLPTDLKRFRALTMGRPLVMGRRTYAGLGRPLAGRHMLVVTRDPAYPLPDGVLRAGSLGAALDAAAGIAEAVGAPEIVVGGGAEIYREALPRAARLALSEVALSPEADSFFPPLDPAIWREAARERGARGPRDEAAFDFVDYVRRGG